MWIEFHFEKKNEQFKKEIAHYQSHIKIISMIPSEPGAPNPFQAPQYNHQEIHTRANKPGIKKRFRIAYKYIKLGIGMLFMATGVLFLAVASMDSYDSNVFMSWAISGMFFGFGLILVLAALLSLRSVYMILIGWFLASFASFGMATEYENYLKSGKFDIFPAVTMISFFLFLAFIMIGLFGYRNRKWKQGTKEPES